MKQQFLPLVRPRHPTAIQLLPALKDILNSGVVTNNGPLVRLFEQSLTSLLGVPTLVFSSGMAALIAMLRAAGVAGGEVICPSFTFCATPHAIVLAGATPVFCDIDPKTLTLDNTDIERCRHRRDTRAILGVDPYGIGWQPEPCAEPVLIDSAPAFGTSVGDGFALRGLAQIFSFHATKAFSTMEGGALFSQDPDLTARARAIRNFGQDDGGDCLDVGFNGKMLEICAAIGLKQLEDWPHRLARRVEAAVRLRQALVDQSLPGLRVQRAPLGQSPVWLHQPVFIEPAFGLGRDAVMAALALKGIQTRPYYRACHQLACYTRMTTHAGPRHLPVTERLAAQVIALPVYDGMLDAEIAQIATAFRDIRP